MFFNASGSNSNKYSGNSIFLHLPVLLKKLLGFVVICKLLFFNLLF